MPVSLNHLIVPAKDKWGSARFLALVLGTEAGPEWAHFVPVRTANGVTLDFAEFPEFRAQHYAFLVEDSEFDPMLKRIRASRTKHYADFDGTGVGEVNRLYGGRGVYFDGPEGHMYEIITQPYAAVPERWIDGAAVKLWG